MRNFRNILSLFLFLVLAAGIAGTTRAGETFRGDGILVGDVWARASKVRNSAAYMTVTNESKETARLVAASSPVAERVEIHTTIIEDGVMKMRPLEAIEIPPGETVRLEPGGRHVMLLGLRRALKPGDRIELTLVFADGRELGVAAEVRQATGMKMKMKMGDGGHGGGEMKDMKGKKGGD